MSQLEHREWGRMESQPRRLIRDLTATDIPVQTGVYALYRNGDAVYVGKAASLRGRVWSNHLRRGASMTNSALRRNVAEHLGIASSADIKARRYIPSLADAARVTEWIREASIAWIECANEGDAVALEGRLKSEWMPPLTKL